MIVAVVGLSGVGKSTMIASVAQATDLRHVQASELIKTGLARGAAGLTSEALRQGPVLSNQTVMIEEFRRYRAMRKGPIIFDGHTIIDTPEGLVIIPASVFRDLSVDEFVFLRDEPARIYARRATDTSRVRPMRSVAELELQQMQAMSAARDIAATSQKRLTTLSPEDGEMLRSIILGGP